MRSRYVTTERKYCGEKRVIYWRDVPELDSMVEESMANDSAYPWWPVCVVELHKDFSFEGLLNLESFT